MLTRLFTASRVSPICQARRLHALLDPSRGLSEENCQVYAAAADFANRELAPNMAKWDETEHFPVETLRKAASLGFAG